MNNDVTTWYMTLYHCEYTHKALKPSHTQKTMPSKHMEPVEAEEEPHSSKDLLLVSLQASLIAKNIRLLKMHGCPVRSPLDCPF